MEFISSRQIDPRDRSYEKLIKKYHYNYCLHMTYTIMVLLKMFLNCHSTRRFASYYASHKLRGCI